jgi:hypothetical protein
MSHYSSVLKVQELKPMVESPCGPSAPNQGSQSHSREATKKPDYPPGQKQLPAGVLDVRLDYHPPV